jgi:hypothetical protein
MKTEKNRMQELAGIIKEGEEVETVNTAKKGDFIVKNPTGEEYVLTPEKFNKNYIQEPVGEPDSKGYVEYKNKPEERNVVEITSEVMKKIKNEFKDNLPSQKEFFKFAKDFETKKAEKNVTVKARKSEKEEEVVTVTKSEDDGDDVFKFEAPWGEDMILKAGDVLVVSSDEVYRIGKNEFEKTYRFIKEK